MRSSVTVCFLLLLALLLHSANAQTCGGGSGGGTDEDFESPDIKLMSEYSLMAQVNDSRVHFVAFYVPWCRNCKRAAKEWKELGKLLTRDYPNIALSRLNCDREERFCTQIGLEKLPAMHVYYKGKKQLLYKPHYVHHELMTKFITKFASNLWEMCDRRHDPALQPPPEAFAD